jgi:hypothetical protein
LFTAWNDRAFAATHAAQDRMNIYRSGSKLPLVPDLSVQQMLDCCDLAEYDDDDSKRKGYDDFYSGAPR